MSEVDYLRKDRDKWIEAWRKAIKEREALREHFASKEGGGA